MKLESITNGIGMDMVKLPMGYYVSRFETRQREFEAVMGCNPIPDRVADRPVGNVTGDRALEFCRKLTELERAGGSLPAGFVYRLPSFDQWLEYVADASLEGSITPTSLGGRKLDGPLHVGSGEVNCYGLRDLRGNVKEYTRDRYRNGSLTIAGAWWNEHRKDFLRVRNRSHFLGPDEKSGHVGFRCVLMPEAD